jgi:UDPglucose 6-dehydrogenase
LNVSVVGSGYVGLVTGACLAKLGHRVWFLDAAPKVLESIRSCRPLFYEPGLEQLLRAATRAGRVTATSDFATAVARTSVSLIAVGTPNRDGKIDLGALERCCRAVGAALKAKRGYHVVAVKSTVVPTTTELRVREWLEEASGRKAGVGFGLCMNPEFLREGFAVADFMHPDRIVIGAHDRRSAAALKRLYAGFRCPVVVTSLGTAEMIKYATNALLATVISYSNEIAALCEDVGGIDAADVLRAVQLDGRLSPRSGRTRVRPKILDYLWHGAGFGGSCLPKDVQAISQLTRGWGWPAPLLNAVLEVNRSRPAKLAQLCEEALGSVEGRRIAVLGLAFKAGTDDIRESPALPVIRTLVSKGAHVVVHDPLATGRAYGGSVADLPVEAARDWKAALKGASAAILVTGWPVYRRITPRAVKTLMVSPVIVDGRGFFDRRRFERAGVRWVGLGYRERSQ